MRTRSAKKLAQRIDLNYFKHAHGMRRWRTLLSVAAPLSGLVWLGGMAGAGSRAPYSSGPVSPAHAFVEMKCEVCHQRDTAFRAHVGEKACLTCHDAPPHPPTNPSDATARQAPPLNAAIGSPQASPDCASCHREHQGRVRLAQTRDTQCVDCHAESKRMAVGRFPDDHPQFAVMRDNVTDPGTLKFNHAAHANESLRGPGGPEKLECWTCHKPEIARVSSPRRMGTGLMRSVNYEQQCARCHPLFFDVRIDAAAPHEQPSLVRAFVRQSLHDYIVANPHALSEPDGPDRRLPLNFPREPEPQARTPQEWTTRRAAGAEAYLWKKACAECHAVSAVAAAEQPPQIAPVNLTAQWMPKARFDHAPHLMVECASCHTGAEKSRKTSDVLMPAVAACATCHAPSKGASSQCVECHGYHDWTRANPVKPQFKLTDFQ